MGRGSLACSCCIKEELNRGPWTPEEDNILRDYIQKHGHKGNWRKMPKQAGLKRCGKSCRLRWLNYLRPDLKRGSFSEDEAELIIRLHSLLGNRWSLIAGRIPGRSDNEVKNFWNFHLSKKLLNMGINPKSHKPLIPVKSSAEAAAAAGAAAAAAAAASAAAAAARKASWHSLQVETSNAGSSPRGTNEQVLFSDGSSNSSTSSSFSSPSSSTVHCEEIPSLQKPTEEFWSLLLGSCNEQQPQEAPILDSGLASAEELGLDEFLDDLHTQCLLSSGYLDFAN